MGSKAKIVNDAKTVKIYPTAIIPPYIPLKCRFLHCMRKNRRLGFKMLIEFSVANYRSVKDRQTLSMVPGSSKSVRRRHVLPTGVESAPLVLRAMGVYGANGSGKSTLIGAMEFARQFVRHSASGQLGDRIEVKPYLLAAHTRAEPSEFEFIFAASGSLYQYGFKADAARVWSEWLYVTHNGGRNQKWIERDFDPATKDYRTYLNPAIPGEKKVWKDSTRDNALLLSVATQLNATAFHAAFEWITGGLRTIPTRARIDPAYTAEKFKTDRERVRTFLLGLDIRVDDVVVREQDAIAGDPFRAMPEEVKKYFLPQLADVKVKEVSFVHIAEDGARIAIPFKEESDGIQALFSLAGPWIDVSDDVMTVAVDELHNSLHPLAFRYLIENFFSGPPSKKGGQLIFTSHNTLAMESRTLHRDQILFVENHLDTGTVFTPLSDFKSRAGESFRTGYLGGRYGGVPSIVDESLPLPFEPDAED